MDRFVWDEASVAAFWNRLSAHPGIESQYFSLQRGHSVLKYLMKRMDLHSRIVADIGCGPGHMLKLLSDQGIRCIGVDTSVNSVAEANRKLSDRPTFLGAKVMTDFYVLPLEAASVDGVILMETIEHLFEEKIPSILFEVRRVLKPGGFLMLTTPFDEDLEAGHVTCRGCRTVFHPVQHLNSFDDVRLSGLLADAGFTKIVCEPAVFWPRWRSYLYGCGRRPKTFCPSCGSSDSVTRTGFVKRLFGKNLRTLIYLGRV